MRRTIFHVDVNSAYLSWEAARRVANGEEDLRNVPSIVGGDPNKRRGIVLAKSIPAKDFDIKTGEPVGMALRKCPFLKVVPPDFRFYQQCSLAFKAICREYTPVVEEFSIDECFMDMTGSGYMFPDPVKAADELRERVKNELGFTVNVGVGSNKLLAKMASDFKKPDRTHTLFTEEIESKMWPLPVEDLLFVGRSTAERLKSVYILTIGELAHADIGYLKSVFGVKQARLLSDYANGIDDSPVKDTPDPAKSYSMSTTLEKDVTSYERANKILLELTDSVSRRMRKDGVKARCVTVSVRFHDFKTVSHGSKLYAATDISNEIYAAGRELLEKLWNGSTPIRLIGIALSDVTDSGEQLSLFEDKSSERSRKLDKTVDSIKDRFGGGAVKRASSITDKNSG